MSNMDIKRIEAAVETLYDLANIGTSLLEAIQALVSAGYTSEEIRLALDMFHWDHHRLH